MLRKLHSLPGLLFAVLLSVVTATGSILAFDSFGEGISAPSSSADQLRVSDAADRIAGRFPELERISRAPSGQLRVDYAEDGVPRAAVVDPITVEILGEQTVSPTMRTITNLHRAWLSGDIGRLVAGGSALVLLVLTITGLWLLKRQLGGWARLALPLGGSGMRRWHLEIGRVAAAGLLLSSVTGVYLSLAGFDVIPDGAALHDALIAASGGAHLPLRSLAGLDDLQLGQLREITFPRSGDAADPISIKTDAFARQVDPATGAVMTETAHSLAWQVHDVMYRLHTARGMAVLALVLGLSSAAGTILALTGAVTWLRKRRVTRIVAGNCSPAEAEILLLVGSEGGTTWAFARTLHEALIFHGHKVHLAAMNDLPANAPKSQHLFVLAATAGNGEAPTSADHFLNRLANWRCPEGVRASVLGFGDRQFPSLCGYAHAVAAALRDKGVATGVELTTIDRQSLATFKRWGEQISAQLGSALVLDHLVSAPQPHRFTLLEREDYGQEMQAATAILRFRVDGQWRPGLRALQRLFAPTPRFLAGDLVAICPPGEARPRLYSIASSSRTGILEICVRKLPSGVCSEYLHSLVPGSVLEAGIRANPAFRPDRSRRPLVLIGAGAGIAPLIGFVREAGHARPVHLYWGGRNPASDYLYGGELELHRMDGRLAGLRTIFSRQRHDGQGGYVQHLIAADSTQLRALIGAGAQILVCGGRDMAEGVGEALSHALAPLGLSLAKLRQQGRLVEDVY